MWQTAKLSHHPGAFRPVPQSCTVGTLLRRKTEIPPGHATLTLTYIIKQALIVVGQSNALPVELSLT